MALYITPTYRRLGGPQSRSGRSCEEKNSRSLPGIEPDRPARSLVSEYHAITFGFKEVTTKKRRQ